MNEVEQSFELFLSTRAPVDEREKLALLEAFAAGTFFGIGQAFASLGDACSKIEQEQGNARH